MKKLSSYFVALVIGLLAVAIPLNYTIPMLTNSYLWIYIVVASGLMGFFLVTKEKLHLSLKVLMVYLFFNSFFSQAPAESFNAYILVTATVYFYLLCLECDYAIIIKMIQTVFWFELLIATMQYFGRDRLLCFGSTVQFNDQGMLVKVMTDKVQHVFFGTVFQQMRLASLFAIMSPFLLVRSRLYIIPILFTCIMLGALGYSFAIVAGIVVYYVFEMKRNRKVTEPAIFIALAVTFAVFCAVKSWSHIRVEVVEGRLPIWWVGIKTWVLDTTGPMGKKDLFGISQTGPFKLDKFLLGHGMDTFLPLFPLYKHDPNPFPQLHNDWFQIPWEIGIMGFSLFLWFAGYLIKCVWDKKEIVLLAGLTIISVNMFFAFPWRMTQTILIMVAFVALCVQRTRCSRESTTC